MLLEFLPTDLREAASANKNKNLKTQLHNKNKKSNTEDTGWHTVKNSLLLSKELRLPVVNWSSAPSIRLPLRSIRAPTRFHRRRCRVIPSKKLTPTKVLERAIPRLRNGNLWDAEGAVTALVRQFIKLQHKLPDKHESRKQRTGKHPWITIHSYPELILILVADYPGVRIVIMRLSVTRFGCRVRIRKLLWNSTEGVIMSLLMATPWQGRHLVHLAAHRLCNTLETLLIPLRFEAEKAATWTKSTIWNID